MPYRCLFPAIMLFCAIGVYSLNNNAFDVYAIAFFGVLGYCSDQAAAASRRRCCSASSSAR